MTPVINGRNTTFTEMKNTTDFQKSTFFTSGTDN